MTLEGASIEYKCFTKIVVLIPPVFWLRIASKEEEA